MRIQTHLAQYKIRLDDYIFCQANYKVPKAPFSLRNAALWLGSRAAGPTCYGLQRGGPLPAYAVDGRVGG